MAIQAKMSSGASAFGSAPDGLAKKDTRCDLTGSVVDVNKPTRGSTLLSCCSAK